MNPLRTAITAGLALAFMFVSRPVMAQPEENPARGPIPFSTYDKDGDGAITEAEFGEVKEERMARRAAEGRPMRGAAHAPGFSDFDANSDGKLTPEELTTGQKAQAEKRRGAGMGRGRGAGKGKGMGPGAQMPSFGDYDLDGDGTIVEKEFHEARAKRIGERAKQGRQMRKLGDAPAFGDLDSDGDGKVSEQEFAAHQAQRREGKEPK